MGYCRCWRDFEFHLQVVLYGVPRHELGLLALYLFVDLSPEVGDGVLGQSRPMRSPVYRSLHLFLHPWHSGFGRAPVGSPFLEEVCVCVYLSSGFKGQCFNYAIPIAKSYPPMTSLPCLGLVVLPLRTPGGLARRVSN